MRPHPAGPARSAPDLRDWLPDVDTGPTLTACRRWWDGVQVPTWTGLYTVAMLRERSGPVIEDQVGQLLTWLVPARSWDARLPLPLVTLLGAGRTVQVPPPEHCGGAWTGGPVIRWLSPPDGTCLTDPEVLYAALAEALGADGREPDPWADVAGAVPAAELGAAGGVR